ncbi:MAG: type I-C CRISPR-associated protein Cas8c/Csd1 [Candidatus Omnitrophica bacterium]|nr:type I-C CRISPR-associated protein Cas8c/Csd1 [Candidatus Omnitrophota bacterium]
MILQALYELYERKAADPESKIAPEGWEWKEIPFLAVIDNEGNFLRFEDTREGEGRKKRAKRFLVPQGEKRTVGIKAFLLWDNIEYALGANPRKREDIKQRFTAFQEKLAEVAVVHPDVQAVVKFLNKNPVEQIEKSDSPLWQEMLEGNVFITFKVDGSEFATVCDALPKKADLSALFGGDTCLITGEKVQAARLHPAVKGVRGTNTSGAAIVSFNLPAFCSYEKAQNSNAPVSEKATFAYTTALNVLLGKDSPNKVGIGDTTIIFWVQKKTRGYNFESDFAWFFKSDKDDPDRNIQAVKGLYEALYSSKMPLDENNRFYVLGLAPNAARISVRFWKTGTIREFAEKIRQHFEDFSIVHGPKDHDHLSLYQILTSTVLNYKMDNVPPNLASAVVVSILDGLPYPQTLLHQCVRRIRAEQQVTRARTAILKACINRFNRFYNKSEKEVLMSLDKSNTNAAYRLGRLFAVLEKIQEEAAPGINATIRDRFYGAASSTPVTVFPRLLKLKNHHLAKLNPGRKINFEKEIGEICDELKDTFPGHLTLDAQARFAVGYYHQRQDFFKKKSEKNSNLNEAIEEDL